MLAPVKGRPFCHTARSRRCISVPFTAKNGQLFIDDLYVFPGERGTVFVMDVNSDITDVLPHQIGTAASFGFTMRNCRTLADNAPEVMLSLVTNTAVPAGLRPSVAEQQRTDRFPYVVPA